MNEPITVGYLLSILWGWFIGLVLYYVGSVVKERIRTGRWNWRGD